MTITIGSGVNVATTVLGAPIIGSANTATANSMYVSFTQPVSDGGVPIQYYVATANPGGITGTLNQTGSGSVVVGGLTLGQTYTFTVAAYNWFGLGPSSSATNAILVATVPDPPTAVTANFSSLTVVTLTFSAPVFNGGSAITKYVATSSPGNITSTLSQAGSGTITVSGLSVNTLYTFTVRAINSIGTGNASTNSNAVQMSAGSILLATPGLTTWTPPNSYITKVSVIAVGGGGGGNMGGGGGGGLGWKNNIPVTYGLNYNVMVGAGGSTSAGCTHGPNLSTGAGYDGSDSYFCSSCVVSGRHGGRGGYSGQNLNNGGSYNGDGGGSGGTGGIGYGCYYKGGGGGAGGYGYTGGYGATGNCFYAQGSVGYCGGGGGGWISLGGGGVGVYGRGANGTAGKYCGGVQLAGGGSGGGSGGNSTSCQSGSGGAYGGGGGGLGPGLVSFGGGQLAGGRPGCGGGGAVRIIWPGQFRSFPYSCQVGSP